MRPWALAPLILALACGQGVQPAVDAGGGVPDSGPACGVPCLPSQVCVQGSCYDDSCESQVCPPSDVCLSDQCEPVSCVGVSCPAGFACAGGGCQPTSCGGVPCPAGQVCSGGSCTTLTCFGVSCPTGQLCADGLCWPTNCGAEACGGGVCVDGGCESTRCVGVLCPTGDLCVDGGCQQPCNGGCGAPPGQCWSPAGVCVNGACNYLPLDAGSACDDRDPCTLNDACQGDGGCGGTPVVCKSPPGPCWAPAGVCVDGGCDYAPLDAGTACDDGDACTVSDVCDGKGGCAGTAMTCNSPPGQCYASSGSCSAGKCSYPAKASGTACSGANGCQTYTCNGSGACTGAAKPDGTQVNGVWDVCCNGNATSLTTPSNCGGCGLACAAGDSCSDVGSACGGTKAYYCGCTANSQCPKGGTCVNTYWQACWYYHCAAGAPGGACGSQYCGPNETVHQACSGGGCSFGNQPCYCEY